MTACGTCGHDDDRPAAEDHAYYARLEAQVIHVPPKSVNAETFRIAQESCSCREIVADTPKAKSRIKRPFYYANALWIATGAVYGDEPECDCYQVVPRNRFKEKTQRYSDGAGDTEEEHDQRIYAPMGPYHGMIVWNGKQEYVLVGPETTFKRQA